MKYFKALKHVPDPHQGIMYGKGTIIAVDDEKLACTDRELWEEVKFPTLELLSAEMRKNIQLEADNADLNQRLANSLLKETEMRELLLLAVQPKAHNPLRPFDGDEIRERIVTYLKGVGALNASFR